MRRGVLVLALVMVALPAGAHGRRPPPPNCSICPDCCNPPPTVPPVCVPGTRICIWA